MNQTTDPLSLHQDQLQKQVINTIREVPEQFFEDLKQVIPANDKLSIFRWFKFTLKPPYTVASGNLLSAIWDTSHWTSFVKFGLKTA